jgi:integrase/recombinase XerD
MDFFTDYLVRSHYGDKRRHRYTASALHFGDWLRDQGAGPGDIDEPLIGCFLTGHLRTCSCDHPIPHGLILNSAALNNLLRVLRRHNIAATPAPDAIQIELVQFDAKTNDVWD